MATKEQVFGVLAAASAALSREELGEKVGQPVREWQTRLKGWMDKGFIKDTGDQHYVLTDTGREEALKQSDFKDIEDEIEREPGFASEQPVVKSEQPIVKSEQPQAGKQPLLAEEQPGLAGGENEPTQESLATTEYQQFLKLGKVTGVVPLALIKQTADYIWEGGDFRDMTWVRQAMKDMDIRDDLAGRWWSSWRGKMHRPIPTDLPTELLPGKKTDGGEKKEAKGKRDYIMNEDDNPTYVGEGLGDLDHDEALDLAKIRAGAAARRKGAAPVGTSSPVDDAIKIVNLVKSTVGDKAAGKAYIVKPGEDGGFQVEEAEPGRPIVVSSQAPATKPSGSYYVDSDGTVKELQPGQPMVIIKEAPKQVATSGTHYVVDQKGEVKEVAPGQPIVIIRESAQLQSTPIQVKDKDGNPMVLDLSTFIKLEEHRDKQRREEESHETKMEIAKSFKDMLNKAGTALSHVFEGEEEEK